MVFKYSWFKVNRDEKFENHNFIQQEITEPRLVDIKARTIGDYTDIDTKNPPDSVWSDGHLTELLSKIDNARRSLLETDLEDAIKNYTGEKHKVNVDGTDKEILETLYLDVDKKNWDVEDIVTKELHEDFYQAVFRTKDEKLSKKQLMLLNPIEVEDMQDYKKLVKLSQSDWQKVIESNMKNKQFLTISKTDTKIGISLNIDFRGTDIHMNSVKKVFPSQKVKFMPISKTLKMASVGGKTRLPIKESDVARGDYKRKLAKPDYTDIRGYNYDALEDAVDLNEDEEGLKNILLALNEFSRESDIQEAMPEMATTTFDTTYGKGIVQGVPFDAGDYIEGLEIEIADEDSGKILETVFGTIEELRKDPRFEKVLDKYEISTRKAERYIKRLEEDSKKARDKLSKTNKKRQKITLTGTSNLAIKKMFQSEDKTQLRGETLNWLSTINDNGNLYRLFQQILLPMSVDSQGYYKINLVLNKKGLKYDGKVKSWEYNQTSELDTKFLSMPAGSQSRVDYNIGRKTEKGKTQTSGANYREESALGYNPVRQYLTKFVTNRLSKLDKAINTLRGN